MGVYSTFYIPIYLKLIMGFHRLEHTSHCSIRYGRFTLLNSLLVLLNTYTSLDILKGSLSGDFGGGGGASSCRTLITPAFPRRIFDFFTCGCGILTFGAGPRSKLINKNKQFIYYRVPRYSQCAMKIFNYIYFCHS